MGEAEREYDEPEPRREQAGCEGDQPGQLQPQPGPDGGEEGGGGGGETGQSHVSQCSGLYRLWSGL